LLRKLLKNLQIYTDKSVFNLIPYSSKFVFFNQANIRFYIYIKTSATHKASLNNSDIIILNTRVHAMYSPNVTVTCVLKYIYCTSDICWPQ